MHNQELFDRVKTHLLTQMEKSEGPYNGNGDDICKYRGENGLKCAVGGIIPDDKYDPSIETYVLDRNMWANEEETLEPGEIKLKQILIEVGVEEENTDLLADLQTVHDSYQPEEWERELANVAQEYELEN